MKLSKRITSVLLVLVMVLSAVPFAAVAEGTGYPVIEVGSTVNVEIPADGFVYYQFTTDSEGGWYSITSNTSDDDTDPIAGLYKGDTEVAFSDDADEYNFEIICKLEANTDYVLELYSYNVETVSYSVSFVKFPAAESVTIMNGESVTTYIDCSYQLEAALSPADSLAEINWSSDDEEIAVVDSYGVVTGIAAGTATITAESDDGLSDTIEVKVSNTPELQLNTSATVNINAENSYMYYTFTPAKSGYYSLYSKSNEDTRAYLYDSNGLLAQNDDYNGYNFNLKYMLEAGKTYTYGVRYYGRETGSFNVFFEELPYITKLEVTQMPDKTEYITGFASEALSFHGLEMKVTWSDNTTTDWAYNSSAWRVEGEALDYDDSNIEGTGEVIIYWNDVKTSFKVTIVENPVESIEVIEGPSDFYVLNFEGYMSTYTDPVTNESKEYFYYHTRTPEALIQINYKDGTSETGYIGDYIDDFIIEWDDNQSWENQWVLGSNNASTVSYLGVTANLPITVIENPVESLEVVSGTVDPYYENYNGEWRTTEGVEYFHYNLNDPSDLVIKINYTDGESVTVKVGDSVDNYSIDYGSDQSTTHWTVGGDNNAYVSYLGVTAPVPATVLENSVKSVELITAPSREYIYGDSEFGYLYSDGDYDLMFLDLTGLSFKVNYKDGTSKTITDKDLESKIVDGQFYIGDVVCVLYWDYSPSIGIETVTLNYFGCELEFDIVIKESPVSSIEVTKAPDKNEISYNYIAPTFEGLELKITNKDGTTETVTATKDNIGLDPTRGLYIEHNGSKIFIQIDYVSDDYLECRFNYLDVATELEIPIVDDKEIEDITISGLVANNCDGMTVNIKYTDGTSESLRIETVTYLNNSDIYDTVVAYTENGYVKIYIEESSYDDDGNVTEYAVEIFYMMTFVKAASRDVIYGDINMNGKVDITDYVLLKRAFFGTYDLTHAQFTRANINDKNNVIDITDYVLCKRLFFGTYEKTFEGEYVDPYEIKLNI